MSIQDRMHKVNQVVNAKSTRYFHHDKVSKTYGVHMESVRTGDPYQVGLEWKKDKATGKIFMDSWVTRYDSLELKADSLGRLFHVSHFNKKTVSYQVLAAIKYIARGEGKEVSFCEDPGHAYLVSQFKTGRNPFRTYVTNGAGAKVYMVISDREEPKTLGDMVDREGFEDRVSLMRGKPEEAYID